MASSNKNHRQPGYAGVDFIKAAVCPLDFVASPLGEHPGWEILHADKALADLEVGEPLKYPRQFWYLDQQKNRKRGTQIITAPFGFSPEDFDLWLGIYSWLWRKQQRGETISEDGLVEMSLSFLARLGGMPYQGGRNIQRLRSRLFRLSFVTYANSAFWNRDNRSYDVVTFGLFKLDSLSRLMASRRPVGLRIDTKILSLLPQSRAFCFDQQLYRSLEGAALRRLYLIANRECYHKRCSPIYLADDFATQQMGYCDDEEANSQKRSQRQRDQRRKLKQRLDKAADLGLIRPHAEWGDWFSKGTRGYWSGKVCLRFERGPVLKSKKSQQSIQIDDLQDDALWSQIREFTDQQGEGLHPQVYQNLKAEYGEQRLQRHIRVVLAQKERDPKSFTKSEAATFVDRVKQDYADPDWYQQELHGNQLCMFDDIQPNQQSQQLLHAVFGQS